MSLTVGSLFSGIGGLDLGLERAGMEVRWQVECDPYAQKVLRKHWPKAVLYGDVHEVGAHSLEHVDLICGGFPCQDISNAGTRRGLDGERSGLWTEFSRLIRELRPRYVLVENVAALVVRGLDAVLGDLAASGYDAEWDCIPAAAVGAPHRRDRLFIVAYSVGESAERRRERRELGGLLEAPGRAGHSPSRSTARDRREDVADSDDAGFGSASRVRREDERRDHSSRRGEDVPYALFAGLEGHVRGVMALADYRRYNADPAGSGWWATEPDVGRVAHGVPSRVDRLRCLGNAVVPQVAEFLGRRIAAHAEVA